MKKPCLEDRGKCINIQKRKEMTDKRAMALKQRKKLAEQNRKARKQSPEGLLSKEKRAGKPWPLSLGANGSHPPSAEELNEEHEASER